MKHTVWIASLAALSVAGCQPKEEAAAAPESNPPAQGIAAGEERSSDDIAIHSPEAGSMAPVTGGENLQGSGAGGVGNSAKSLAKDVAQDASSRSSDDAQPPSDDGG